MKLDEEGQPRLRVTFPKYKEGEGTVREARVPANFGNILITLNLQTKIDETSICKTTNFIYLYLILQTMLQKSMKRWSPHHGTN